MTPNPLQPDFPVRHSGFTLLEMLVTVVVLSVLMAIAIPGFRQFNLASGATAELNGLLGNLNTARSEALKAATNVRVASAAGGWTNGWTIMIDRDMDGTLDAGDGDRVIMQTKPVRNGLTMSAATDPAAAAVTFFYYGPSGSMVTPASALRFTLRRPDDPVGRRCIQVDLSGRTEGRKGGGSC